MDSILKVGIDVGSTTIKLVVMDHEKKILYKNYARHFSEIGNALQENLTHLKEVVGEKKFSFALTGSAGMGIAQRIGLPFVQEVIACAAAVKELIPQTDTVVELGGEDAKITYFGDAPEQRMNGVCAGGTGSFIDHMASLLSTDAPGLNALAEKGKQIYKGRHCPLHLPGGGEPDHRQSGPGTSHFGERGFPGGAAALPAGAAPALH